MEGSVSRGEGSSSSSKKSSTRKSDDSGVSERSNLNPNSQDANLEDHNDAVRSVNDRASHSSDADHLSKSDAGDVILVVDDEISAGDVILVVDDEISRHSVDGSADRDQGGPIPPVVVPYNPYIWSFIDPGTFEVRDKTYFRDNKKVLAPNYAAYYPIGVEIIFSLEKLDHIARIVELPPTDSYGTTLPPILVVNIQVPSYPAAIFQGEKDGDGMNFVLYFKLSEDYSEKLTPRFQENLRRIIDEEVEKVKGFAGDTIRLVGERLKILGRVANVEELHLSAAEKMMSPFNEEPLRPHHKIYSELIIVHMHLYFAGKNYFEVDVDMHRFSYIFRKGFEALQEKLKKCILDVGLTIQGNKVEELPEEIVCCIRLHGIDLANYKQFAINHKTLRCAPKDNSIRRLENYYFMKKRSDFWLNAEELDAVWKSRKENRMVDDATNAEEFIGLA